MRRFTAFMMIFVLVLAPTLAQADFQDEMQGLFNSMTNVTDSGYHQAMGRGVVAGPSVVIRNKRIRTDLINFTPPRLDGGCGGIDMFLGSFSFINAEQFIHLLQAIASNAAGYAFKLALSVMCPSCKQVMESLQKTIQQLNQIAGDSCRAAQFMVDTAADKMGAQGLKEQMENGPLSSAARALGQSIDEFDSYLNKINTGTSTSKLRGYQVNALLGNVAWRVLRSNGYISAAFNSGNTELAEALMSVTGTVVGTKAIGDDEYAMPMINEYSPTISYKDLMEGGSSVNEVKKYSCDSDDCLAPTQVAYNFKGLQKLVNEVLLGPDDSSLSAGSLVAQLLSNNGTLSDQAKQLIRVAPYHTTRLRNMAVCTMAAGGVGSLEQYAREASGLIALEVLEKYLRDVLAALNVESGAITINVDGKTFTSALSPTYQQKLQKLAQEVREADNVLDGAKRQALEQIYQSSVATCNLKNLTVRKGG